METVKRINISLDTTLLNEKEWYNSGNKALKETDLQAFSEN